MNVREGPAGQRLVAEVARYQLLATRSLGWLAIPLYAEGNIENAGVLPSESHDVARGAREERGGISASIQTIP